MLIDRANLIGIVVIGRNEGERLARCLDSLQREAELIVYVDSGSTDESVAESMSRGIETLQLDLNLPFTAARARNTGLNRLLQIAPDIKYVQFIDGDCELFENWLNTGTDFLERARARTHL